MWESYVASVDEALQNGDVRSALEDLGSFTNVPRQFQAVCLEALELAATGTRDGVHEPSSKLEMGGSSVPRRLVVTSDAIIQATRKVCGMLNDHPSSVLGSRSMLDLFVVVACVRLEQRGLGSFNVHHIHSQFSLLKQSAGTQASVPDFTLEGLQASMEALAQAGILAVATGRSGTSIGWRGPIGMYRKVVLLPSRRHVASVIETRCGVDGDTPHILLEWFRKEQVGQQEGEVGGG